MPARGRDLQRIAAIEIGAGILRIEFDRLVEIGNRLVVFLLADQRDAAIVVGRSVYSAA